MSRRSYCLEQVSGEGQVSGRSNRIGDDQQGAMILGQEVSAPIIDGKPLCTMLEVIHEDLPEPKGVKGDEFL